MEFINFLDVEGTLCSADGAGKTIFQLVGVIIQVIQIGIPILLIIMGSIDLGKAVVKSDEKEIKAGQKIFMSRVITALIIFFIVTIVRMVLGILPDGVVGPEVDACIEAMFPSS